MGGGDVGEAHRRSSPNRWDRASLPLLWDEGHACGHGYPSACWGLQRSLWLSCARAGDWDIPAGLRSCRWNLCVHSGRSYFFECCQQEALKINQGNITEESSLGNKFQSYLKFSNNSMSSQDSQPGLSQRTLPMGNEDWRRFCWLDLSVYYGANRPELCSPVLTRELEMWGLWHRKNWSWWAQASCFYLIRPSGSMLEEKSLLAVAQCYACTGILPLGFEWQHPNIL